MGSACQSERATLRFQSSYLFFFIFSVAKYEELVRLETIWIFINLFTFSLVLGKLDAFEFLVPLEIILYPYICYFTLISFNLLIDVWW